MSASGFAGPSPSCNNGFTQGLARKSMKKGLPHSFTGCGALPAKKGYVSPVQERREAKPLYDILPVYVTRAPPSGEYKRSVQLKCELEILFINSGGKWDVRYFK